MEEPKYDEIGNLIKLEEPVYDEMGNLINQKKTIRINLFHLIIGGMLIIAIIIGIFSITKNSDNSKIEEAIKENSVHIENKDTKAYADDLSMKIPKGVRDYLVKAQEYQFKNYNANIKLYIDDINIVSKEKNEAVVLVNMKKEFILENGEKKYIKYKLKHYLYKENNKYKFYKTFIVNNKK